MLNVFVISSDKRVDSLIEHFQPFFKSKIRCASDFDNGLKEVFENRPSVVFIQSTIGTVSGETVSRHIKSLLGPASPRIIFMGDIDSSSKKGTSWCDDWICVSDSEQQMQQDFAELISRCFPEDWREISLEMEKTSSFPAETTHEVSYLGAEATLDLPQQSGAAGSETDISGKTLDYYSPTETLAAGAEVSRQVGENLTEEDFPAYQNLYHDPFLENVVSRSKFHSIGKILSVLVLLAVAGSGIYFWTMRKVDNSTPGASSAVAPRPESAGGTVAPPVKVEKGIKGLPPFVRSEWRDSLYSSQHPGWERYVSPDADYRIYRKNETIKALQGLTRGGDGFSETSLAQIFRQVGISGPLPSGNVTSENGFLVTSYLLPKVAELVTYQKQGSTQIEAFVLEFL